MDAFFVLSGFLITSLLLAERQQHGTIRLAAFRSRRARWLLPALLLALFVVAAISPALVPTDQIPLLRGDALAALAYLANWRMIYRGDGYSPRPLAPLPSSTPGRRASRSSFT